MALRRSRLKGQAGPTNREEDRLALVAALDPVDHAVLFDEETPAGLIRLLRPDLHVKGGDYADEALPEAEAVREVGGRVVILPLAGTKLSPQRPQRPQRAFSALSASSAVNHAQERRTTVKLSTTSTNSKRGSLRITSRV